MSIASTPKMILSLFTGKRTNAPVLERDPPKEPPPPKKEFGRYCIKTNVYIQNEQNGNVLAKLTGKSPDWDIIPQTVHACKTVRNGRVRGGVCSEPDVNVMSYDDDCDGTVTTVVY